MPVSNKEEVLRIVKDNQDKRVVKKTEANDESSRSHTIF